MTHKINPRRNRRTPSTASDNDQVWHQELELVRTLVTEKVKAGQLRLNYL
ncbi:MAG: hypothetical protein O9338_15225 [Microcystis sp. LE19-251.1A]|nr:hypothetical protein [Microcystis aeruginosa]MCZ8364061.1 hypothetical protein [Microcystis sp. LE19-251.1A]